MDKCIKFREELPLVTLVRDGQHFCYDALALYRFLRTSEQITVTPEELATIRHQALLTFPQQYIITYGDRATPHVFPTEEQAIRFVETVGRGSVYQVAQIDDPILAAELYPQNLAEDIPVFAVRKFIAQGLTNQSLGDRE